MLENLAEIGSGRQDDFRARRQDSQRQEGVELERMGWLIQLSTPFQSQPATPSTYEARLQSLVVVWNSFLFC